MIDLMSTVSAEWLAVLFMTAMSALAVGGYVGLWKLTAWLDEREDQRRTVALAAAIDRKRRAERAATDRVQATYPVRRYRW